MNDVFSHPILSCAEAGAWEKRLLPNEAAEWDAMQRAGAALAAAVAGDAGEIGGLPADARLLVLAGKGHNGGDALLAAREILAASPQATAEVVLCFEPTSLRPLARRALAALRESAPGRVSTGGPDAKRDAQKKYALCLDGVFGFQFRPPMDAATAAVLAAVNAHPGINLRAAVDLPSGLDDGAGSGRPAFRTDFTYATGIVKRPAALEANVPMVGRLRYLDLGFFEAGSEEPGGLDRVLLPAILRPLARLRPAQGDKRTYGHLFVVGGSRNFPGAVLMAAQAALRSGVGLLTAFVPERLVPEYAAHFPEVMWTGWAENAGGGLARAAVSRILERISQASAVVVGPGLGAEPETIAAVEELVRGVKCPLLLDADALRPEVLAAAAGRPVICTPHAGEFKRIGGKAGPRPGLDHPGKKGPVIVLKGPRTRIFDTSGGVGEGTETDHRVFHSFFGGPVLARGGSGDLLAGLTGGLLAQNPDDLLLAACRGVVWHGRAADLLARAKGQVAVQTTQLFDYLQPALHEAQ